MFNNLDYSFVAGYEDGTFDADSPGRGSPELRKQLRFLSDLLNAQDLTNLVPDRDLVKFAPGLVPQAMNDNNGRYIVYFERVDKRDQEVVRIDVPPGTYLIKWMDPESGSLLAEEQIDFQTGRLQLDCPAFGVDAVLYMQRHL